MTGEWPAKVALALNQVQNFVRSSRGVNATSWHTPELSIYIPESAAWVVGRHDLDVLHVDVLLAGGLLGGVP